VPSNAELLASSLLPPSPRTALKSKLRPVISTENISSPPQIDWAREAALAGQSAAANAAGKEAYRDLGEPSSAQLEWVHRNHMEPIPPKFHWDHREVESTGSGLLVVWVGHHCAFVGIILLCEIGQIEARGDLLKHMRDPKEP
jgi:hypothetical protein